MWNVVEFQFWNVAQLTVNKLSPIASCKFELSTVRPLILAVRAMKLFWHL